MHFVSLMRQFACELDLPDLDPAPGQTCAVRVGPTTVTFNPHDDAPALTLRACLGQLPDEGRDDLMARLLRAGFPSTSPDGSAFAVDDQAMVYLTRYLPTVGLGVAELHEAVQALAQRAEAWQPLLAGPPASSGAVESSANRPAQG